MRLVAHEEDLGNPVAVASLTLERKAAVAELRDLYGVDLGWDEDEAPIHIGTIRL